MDSITYIDPQKQRDYENMVPRSGGLLELFSRATVAQARVLQDFAMSIAYYGSESSIDPEYNENFPSNVRASSTRRALNVHYHHAEVPIIRKYLHWYDHLAMHHYPSFRPAPGKQQEITIKTYINDENGDQLPDPVDMTIQLPLIPGRDDELWHHFDSAWEFPSSIKYIVMNKDTPDEKHIDTTKATFNIPQQIEILNILNYNPYYSGRESDARNYANEVTDRASYNRQLLQLDNFNIWTPYEVAQIETKFPVLRSILLGKDNPIHGNNSRYPLRPLLWPNDMTPTQDRLGEVEEAIPRVASAKGKEVMQKYIDHIQNQYIAKALAEEQEQKAIADALYRRKSNVAIQALDVYQAHIVKDKERRAQEKKDRRKRIRILRLQSGRYGEYKDGMN